MRVQIWPLFARSARYQPATVVRGTTGEVAALVHVLSVGMGSANHCGSCTTGEIAALASDRLVSVGSLSHCGCVNDR
jgi:hypothetical protein